MTAFGVTADGFVRKTFADIQTSLFGYWRAKISRLLQLTEKTAMGNLGNGAVVELDEAWQALEKAYYSNDPLNADDYNKVTLAWLTGTTRRRARAGQCPCSCKLATGTYPAGVLVANVAGQPTNRWRNRDTIVVPATATIGGLIFVSEIAGSAAVAPINTLTEIAQPWGGFHGIANDTQDAAPGLDLESLDELEIRRQTEISGSGSGSDSDSGSGSLGAVRARVSKVPGVLSVQSRQNTTRVPGILPAGSYQIVIWDGVIPEAADIDIAQAIYRAGPAGIESFGATSIQVAIGDDGQPEKRSFTRATQLPVYIDCTVLGTALAADIKAAIVAAGAKLVTFDKTGVAGSVVYARVLAAISDTPGVTDVTALAIGYAPSPTGTVNLPFGFGSIALFDATRITVS